MTVIDRFFFFLIFVLTFKFYSFRIIPIIVKIEQQNINLLNCLKNKKRSLIFLKNNGLFKDFRRDQLTIFVPRRMTLIFQIFFLINETQLNLLKVLHNFIRHFVCKTNLFLFEQTLQCSAITRSISNGVFGRNSVLFGYYCLKATSYLTISMHGQIAMGKFQWNNYHHGSCGFV